ncbi:NAD(P)-dependent dehydrogenase, short-chain alcohol dehydrogenase family [Tenacibaculum sp. MAR_2009_124]|uniref:SDR family NAD(P)-dependent oxidoreductase n=1 Tax=Tenacibaculum sp. MAR_2009_124 TaxID=1250059 RepID=UPI00089A34FC|nr:SDR family NAD(P)-dependent oxidoreductase [Tenacibaculum sp. MAR_2009_124]SEB36975.1 NAD(P)-dependent dehydrogenase, short-chain alcohol dehydrogenase family [Tenacibaculum sp. MAR_2009_124]
MTKTILITGSTDGIGKLTALKIANDGHVVILHGRNSEKLENTLLEIKTASNNQSIFGYTADFSDLSSLKKFTSNIIEKHDSLDIIINNAGIFSTSTPKTKDGYDVRFSVNFFAPVILTSTLLSLLKKGHNSKIINLSSAAQATISLEALKGNETLGMQQAYAQSKLAITMWSFYLAKIYPSINTIAVNPGSLLNTKMVQEAYGQFWSSADKGVQILYDLALSHSYKNISGKYFDNDKGAFGSAHADSYNDEKIEELMKVTTEILRNSNLNY